MASVSLQEYIPETMNQFRIYRDGSELLGVARELDLPTLEIITDTVEGAGFWGTHSVPATGHVDDTEWELKFMSYHAHMTQFGDTTQEINLQIRAAEQMQNYKTLKIDYVSWVMFTRGRMIKFAIGKLEPAKKTDSSVTLNLDMVKILFGGEVSIHIDKVLGVYIVDGEDLIAPIKAQL